MNQPLPTPGELLRRHGKPANKRFGQNFLVDATILDRIVDAAGVRAGDRVLEIGPGPGGLTTRLLHRGARVQAIEADPTLVAHLRTAFDPAAALEVVEGDALHVPLPDWIGQAAVVANLPYNVATPILMRLVDAATPPPRMALMFQREVADRVAAADGGPAFGPLAVAVGVRFHATIAFALRPGAFRPPPKVHSAVVALQRRPTPLVRPEREAAVRHLARTAFQQRRKMLRSSLASLGCPDLERHLEAAEVDPRTRPETLDLPTFLRLADHLSPWLPGG